MFFQNKYDLKKSGDFIVFEGHGYPLIYIYNILGLFDGYYIFHPFVPSSIYPSSSSPKKKMMEEEDNDDKWRQQQIIQMFVIQSCSL
jgi:hypothetical protein